MGHFRSYNTVQSSSEFEYTSHGGARRASSLALTEAVLLSIPAWLATSQRTIVSSTHYIKAWP